jgi:hypothetical protein
MIVKPEYEKVPNIVMGTTEASDLTVGIFLEYSFYSEF